MAELPFLPLATDAWLADTSHLDRAERGLYMDLLVLMWRTPGCRVPADRGWIARKLRVSEAEIPTLEIIISEFCQTTGNWITQKRLSKEFERALQTSKKQSGRAKSRWNKDNDESRGNAPTPTPTPTNKGRKEGSARAPESGQKPDAESPSEKPLSDQVPADHHDILSIARDCARAGGVRFVDPGHIATGVALIREWQQAGADPPIMLAAIRKVVAETRQQRIGSLKFFDAAVRREIAQEEAQRHGHPSKRARNAEPSFSELALAQLTELRSREAASLGGGGNDAQRRLGIDAG